MVNGLGLVVVMVLQRGSACCDEVVQLFFGVGQLGFYYNLSGSTISQLW